MTEQADSLRIDRWLFFCRFFKTRSLASAAVVGGHVKLNGERAAPGNRVRSSDRIDLVKERMAYALTVLEIPKRRGPAAETQKHFLEDEDSIIRRKQQMAALKQDRMLMPKTDGRPDKHTRRKIRDRNRT